MHPRSKESSLFAGTSAPSVLQLLRELWVPLQLTTCTTGKIPGWPFCCNQTKEYHKNKLQVWLELPGSSANIMVFGSVTPRLHCAYRVSDALADNLLPGNRPGGMGSITSRQRLQKEADDNLENHYKSVQTISDATTLPQMLDELDRHLNRAAGLDALILRLRCVL